MRLFKELINDIKFQYKYGFYLLYFLITLIYIGIILALPISFRNVVAAIVVFSDPAALGLIFMGAIVLFEKSERVLNSLFISPLKVDEYILSKIFSLSTISTLVGLLIITITSFGKFNLFLFLLGLIFGSTLFSLVGLIIATKVSSLNQFIICLVPCTIILSLPPFLTFFGINNILLDIHPGVIVLRLMLQSKEIGNVNIISYLILFFWMLIIYFFARKNVGKMKQTLGGVVL